MIVQRVEKQSIKPSNPFYAMFCDFAHKSKNLYNHANFLVRKEFLQNDRWLRYGEMDKRLFVSNTGRKINADVNGAYQIMKKVFPKAFADGIEGAALHPVRVSVV